MIDLDAEVFVQTALLKLEEHSSPILYLHAESGVPASAVLIDVDHYNKLLKNMPEDSETEQLVMNHSHLEPED